MIELGREWERRVDEALVAAFPSGASDGDWLYDAAMRRVAREAFVDMSLYAAVHQKLHDTGLLRLLEERTDAANENERRRAAESEARWNTRDPS